MGLDEIKTWIGQHPWLVAFLIIAVVIIIVMSVGASKGWFDNDNSKSSNGEQSALTKALAAAAAAQQNGQSSEGSGQLPSSQDRSVQSGSPTIVASSPPPPPPNSNPQMLASLLNNFGAAIKNKWDNPNPETQGMVDTSINNISELIKNTKNVDISVPLRQLYILTDEYHSLYVNTRNKWQPAKVSQIEGVNATLANLLGIPRNNIGSYSFYLRDMSDRLVERQDVSGNFEAIGRLSTDIMNQVFPQNFISRFTNFLRKW